MMGTQNEAMAAGALYTERYVREQHERTISELYDKIAGDREVMKTALTVLCMARRTWAGPMGWGPSQIKDFDIAVGGLHAALGISDEQSKDAKP